jgi:hypothetical protein
MVEIFFNEQDKKEMKANKGHIQTGIATFILALSGQYGITEFIGNTTLSSSDKQVIVTESVTAIKDYLKSDEYNDDIHKKKFLEFLKSADAFLEISRLIPEKEVQNMSKEDKQRFIKLMRKYNLKFPEDNVWILNID